MLIDDLQGKTRQLGDYILEQIYTGEYASGKPIPSIRSFMKQFGMSQRTVQRTLEILVSNGILESRHGQGTFVKYKHTASTSYDRTIAVILHYKNFETSIYGNVFLGLQQAAMHMSCHVKVAGFRNGQGAEDPEAVQKLTTGAEGLIVLSEDEECLHGARLQVPIVGVCMNDNYNDTASLLDLDPFSAAKTATRFFTENNYKKVHIFTSRMDTYVTRANIFADIWSKQGGSFELSYYDYQNPEFSKPDDDAAILFTSGGTQQVYLNYYFKETGINLNENHLVLELDGKSKINPDYIQTPSIALDWKQIGRMALEEVLYRIDHPGTPARRIYTPGKLFQD